MSQILKSELTSKDAEFYLPNVGWICYPEKDDIATYLMRGFYEPCERAFHWLYLRPGDTYIDCGAHFGLFSLIATKIMQNRGRILSFEPNPQTRKLLQRNLQEQSCKIAKVFSEALWSSEEEKYFYGAAFRGPAYGHLEKKEEATSNSYLVKTKTLDQIFNEEKVEKCDFLKIDAEGAEREILKGGRKIFDEACVSVMMIEFTQENTTRFGYSTKELAEEIQKCGFKLYRFSIKDFSLTPFIFQEEIPYENIFAFRDFEKAKIRLENAAEEYQRIAKEIRQRDEVTIDNRELMSFDYYKEQYERLNSLVGDVQGKERYIEKLTMQIQRYRQLGLVSVEQEYQKMESQKREIEEQWHLVNTKKLEIETAQREFQEKSNRENETLIQEKATIVSARENMQHELISAKKNMEGEIVSAKEKMQRELALAKENMEREISLVKENMQREIELAKENMKFEIISTKENTQREVELAKESMEREIASSKEKMDCEIALNRESVERERKKIKEICTQLNAEREALYNSQVASANHDAYESFLESRILEIVQIAQDLESQAEARGFEIGDLEGRNKMVHKLAGRQLFKVLEATGIYNVKKFIRK